MNPPIQIIGSSRAATELRGMIKAVADSDASVLILGDSGTGKELVARSLHQRSIRRRSNFVPVNCAAIPRDLLESELFGHKRGAFTGAIADRDGRFQLANKGTLFLDEIGDMSLDTQVKLLRVLQEKVVEPIGCFQTIPVDVRVIAATHRDLTSMISSGEFREDLYYRLHVIPVQVPPLRERLEDIPELIRFFCSQFGNNDAPFDSALLNSLCEYSWPGNIRELANLVQRLCTLFPNGRVCLSQVPSALLPNEIARNGAGTHLDFKDPEFPNQGQLDLSIFESEETSNPVEETIAIAQGWTSLPPTGTSLKDHLAEIEKALIGKALRESDGNVSEAARLLCIQRTTLIDKINKYQIHQ